MKHCNTIRLFLYFCLCSAYCCTAYAQEYTLLHYDNHDGLSHHRVSRVIQDSTGMIWIGTYNGLNRFDGYRFTAFKAEVDHELTLPGDRVRRIELTDNNNILCLIDDSVVLFNTRTCRYEPLPDYVTTETIQRMQMQHNPDLWRPKDQVHTLGNIQLPGIRSDYEDRQGNHWLVAENGLYKATPIPPRGNRINFGEVRAMKLMHNGNIVASIQGTKRLAVYDNALRLLGYVRPDGQLTPKPVPFTAQVYCIYETRDTGRVYLGCKPGGLIIADRQDGKVSLREVPQVRNVYDVIEDADGTIWAATFGFGLWRSRRAADGTQGQEFEQVTGTAGMRMRRLLMMDDNTLLAATEDGLLVMNHPADGKQQNDAFVLLQRESSRHGSLSSNAILGLALFDGKLYVATEGGGINRLASGDIHASHPEFEHITHADGLSSDIVYEFLPWSEHELLVQCNNALTILNTTDGSLVNYGKSFFRTAAEQSSNLGEVAPVDLGDGRILVAPYIGIMLLNKSELTPETESVHLALSSFMLDGKMHYAVDTVTRLTLASCERSLGIQFAALDYRGNNDIMYQTRFYAVDEKNPQWTLPSNINQVVIQDVRPGDYVFEVRSTNALGQWLDNTRRIDITVTPMFWESTWGRGLQIGLLLLIAIVIAIQSTRVHYHRKRRTEMLEAYLDLQERYLLVSEQQTTTPHNVSPYSPMAATAQQEVAANRHPQPLPVPEIIAPGYTSENEKFLNTLHVFMEQHISDNNMSIDDIAKVTCMSRSSLNRKMHELFNLSAKDFVQAARIKHACHLLRTTGMASKEVAYACGFSDPRYFSKAFKANTGKTPTEYRESER